AMRMRSALGSGFGPWPWSDSAKFLAIRDSPLVPRGTSVTGFGYAVSWIDDKSAKFVLARRFFPGLLEHLGALHRDGGLADGLAREGEGGHGMPERAVPPVPRRRETAYVGRVMPADRP